MTPLSLRSLNHASHFCIDFCICSGERAVGSEPRNRKRNSDIKWLLALRCKVRRFESELEDIISATNPSIRNKKDYRSARIATLPRGMTPIDPRKPHA